MRRHANIAPRASALSRVAAHQCVEAKPTKGCRATTPVTLRIERHGQPRTIAVYPTYDPSLKRTRIGFSLRLQAHRTQPGRSRFVRLDEDVERHLSGHLAPESSPHLRIPAAQAEVSGIVGVSAVA